MKIEKFVYSNSKNPVLGVEVNGVLVAFSPKSASSRRSYCANSRVYGAADALVADLNAVEPEWVHEAKGVVYDDATVLRGKVWRKWRDSTKKVAGQRLSAVLGALAGVKGLVLPPSTKATFSYKAGCSSCPCSPGFILDGGVYVNGTRMDLHISELSSVTRVSSPFCRTS